MPEKLNSCTICRREWEEKFRLEKTARKSNNLKMKLPVYKVNTQKSKAFLYTNNETAETEIRKKIPLI